MKSFKLQTLAKYPFLPEAKEYVSGMSINLHTIEEHPMYSSAVNLGWQRVQDALKGNVKADLSTKTQQELTILSYVIARIIANATGNSNIINKYCRTEAQNAYEQLRREPSQTISELEDSLGFSIEKNQVGYKEFLELTRDINTKPEWKLVNRQMLGGNIRIRNQSERLTLLREAIKKRILAPINTENIPQTLKEKSGILRERTLGAQLRVRQAQLKKEDLPPCIKKMIEIIASGKGDHKVMFILATFHLSLGMPSDEVVNVFSVSPKFDEEKTRYQLRFLSGEGGATKYNCPGCAKIKSYGLCCEECKINHPLQEYRKRIKNKKKR